MAGNVSEWTSTAYYENNYGFVWDLNPDIQYNAADSDPITLKRKVVRGGSWKDVAYFLRPELVTMNIKIHVKHILALEM